MANLNLGNPEFEAFLLGLGIPESCVLNKPIYKKLFQEAMDGKRSVLNPADKICLKDDVDKIRWLYTLKPDTINIAAYTDDMREYFEVALLHIELSSSVRFKRIATFINRAIPYPLILLFTHQSNNATHLAIHVADKRINQADKEKWVIKEQVNTPWVDLSLPGKHEFTFIDSLAIKNLNFRNFYTFYQSVTERMVAINCAQQTDNYTLNIYKRGQTSAASRLELLQTLEKLIAGKVELANKLKREKQLGKQVELSTKIKKINDRIGEIRINL